MINSAFINRFSDFLSPVSERATEKKANYCCTPPMVCCRCCKNKTLDSSSACLSLTFQVIEFLAKAVQGADFFNKLLHLVGQKNKENESRKVTFP
jgi:hypothetical protein